MRQLSGHGGAEALARVNERVDENELLEPRDDLQCFPRIVGAAEEDHRPEQHVKHETNLLRSRNCPENQPESRKHPAGQDRDRDQQNRMGQLEVETLLHDSPCDRQHYEARHQRLEKPHKNLFERDSSNADRSQQPVLNLFGPAELDHERQRHGLHPRERHAQRQNPGQKEARVTARDDPLARHDIAEDKREEQRLHTDPQNEEPELAPGYA